MRATFRALPAWLHQPRPERPASYTADYRSTLNLLESELAALDASDVVIALVMAERDVRLDGSLRGDARPIYPGVELSFDTPDRGRLTFTTDRHRGYVTRDVYSGPTWKARAWQDNLRAIALGLQALRAVNRYGITSASEQYAGFVLIESGPVERGRRLVDEAGSIDAALKRHHPDGGGHPRALQDVLAYRESMR